MSAPTKRSHSLWVDAWRRLRKNRMAIICGGFFIFICLFAIVGPLLAEAIAGLDGTHVDTKLGARSPSWSHWFGTDQLGRDMLVRTMEGGRYALLVAVTATTVALIIGVSWGAIAAYAGGKVDEVMMRIVDILYAFPTVVFVIVISTVIQFEDPTRKLMFLFAMIGCISWLTMARIVRGQVVPPRRILFRHIVPNTLGPIIVYATLSLPSVMLTEAFLSFLGLGVQAPKASWGTLATEGISQILVSPWLIVAPGLTMGLTIFALNFLGDGLRDALDPQMRKD
jgi:oligopeptide transport system permease protein